MKLQIARRLVRLLKRKKRVVIAVCWKDGGVNVISLDWILGDFAFRQRPDQVRQLKRHFIPFRVEDSWPAAVPYHNLRFVMDCRIEANCEHMVAEPRFDAQFTADPAARAGKEKRIEVAKSNLPAFMKNWPRLRQSFAKPLTPTPLPPSPSPPPSRSSSSTPSSPRRDRLPPAPRPWP
jgi:hypothetical protein